MFEQLEVLNQWMADGRDVALATVVRTWRSAPRKMGAHMAVSDNMEISGSVSGGCVESEVLATALDCLRYQKAELLHFGITDERAWEAGLSCGGEMEVLVQPLPASVLKEIEQAFSDNSPIVYRTLVANPNGPIGGFDLLPVVSEGQSPRTYVEDGRRLFENPLLLPPELIVIGGNHIAQTLSTLGPTIGYRVTIIEPRAPLSQPSRFHPDTRVIPEWPEHALRQMSLRSNQAVIALTHDQKLDDPALAIAIRSHAFYIGALGSKSTQKARNDRLRLAGFADSDIARIDGPAGIDIDAQSPEEIALSILVKLVAMRNTIR